MNIVLDNFNAITGTGRDDQEGLCVGYHASGIRNITGSLFLNSARRRMLQNCWFLVPKTTATVPGLVHKCHRGGRGKCSLSHQ